MFVPTSPVDLLAAKHWSSSRDRRRDGTGIATAMGAGEIAFVGQLKAGEKPSAPDFPIIAGPIAD
jgi:hypothetical protein